MLLEVDRSFSGTISLEVANHNH